MSLRLFVEGGGGSRCLRTACRRGFREFLEKAGLEGRMPRIVACGGRDETFDDFRTAHNQDSAEPPLMLVDAEGPVEHEDPWRHLRQRDGWDQPEGVDAGQCHLMVQMMESWFLADRTALAGYFGADFRAGALPGSEEAVEGIPKADVENGLKHATRDTDKGEYSKGRHSFELLGRLDPARVMAASGWADRLVKTLRGSV